jgi:hypothetical protein
MRSALLLVLVLVSSPSSAEEVPVASVGQVAAPGGNRFFVGLGAGSVTWLEPGPLGTSGGWNLTLGYDWEVKEGHGLGLQARVANHPVESGRHLNLGVFDSSSWFVSMGLRYSPVLLQTSGHGSLVGSVWLASAAMPGTLPFLAGEGGLALAWRLPLGRVDLDVTAQCSAVVGRRTFGEPGDGEWPAAVLPAVVLSLRI